MSYCELVEFHNGVELVRYTHSNNHQGASVIWSKLFDKYLKDPNIEFDSWMRRPKPLWELATSPRHGLTRNRRGESNEMVMAQMARTVV